MKNLTALLALTTLTAGATTIAYADPAPESVRTETVRFADLDTASAQGAAALFRRTQRAARNVCGPVEPNVALAVKHPYTRCVRNALSNAIVAINRPAVTAYAAEHGIFQEEYSVKIARRN